MVSVTGCDSTVRQAFGAVRLFSFSPGENWNTAAKISSGAFLATETADRAVKLIEIEIERISAGALAGSDWLLTIPPVGRDGFAVDLSKSGHYIRGMFGELEEEFETLPQAMTWVRRALSNTYQLRITVIDGRPREWRLEPAERQSEGSIDSIASGHLSFFRTLRSTSTVIRRNAFSA